MSVRKVIILDQNVLTGRIGSKAVPIPAGFDADTVITGIEPTVFDPHPVAAFRVTSIVVAAVAGQCYTVHNHTAAENREWDVLAVQCVLS